MLRQRLRSISLLFGLLLFAALLTSCAAPNSHASRIVVVEKSRAKIQAILQNVVLPAQASHQPMAQIINNVSAALINTPYVAHTLIGSTHTPEKLVINLEGVDCFTFIDNVIALSQSTNFEDFVQHLTQTRYINGSIAYNKRRHFFSDWVDNSPYNATDITAQVSPNTITVTKFLNQRSNGKPFLEGIPVVKRNITFIPPQDINQSVINHLKTGDLIGIYTPIPGLDVTHVGIFIMTPQGPMFRNASSLQKNRKVVDSPFLAYVKQTPGIVIYQPNLLAHSSNKLSIQK